MKPFQLAVMQATKRQRDVTEDSDEEGNFCGKKISPPIHEAKSENVITYCTMICKGIGTLVIIENII